MALRDIIVHNFWWKMLSLLVAGMAWLTIQFTVFQKVKPVPQSPVVKTLTYNFTAVPVTLLAAPSNTSRFKVSPETVSVSVSGAENVMQKLKPEEVKAYVDVSDAGDERFFRRPVQAQIPRAYALESIMVNPTNATIERINGPK
jgi:YbbR domain-containing protein